MPFRAPYRLSGSRAIRGSILLMLVLLNLSGGSNDTSEPIRIPLKRIGRIFLIEARIGDQTGNFVFDTGASRLVLNQTYFRKNLAEGEGTAGGITGTVEKVFHTRIDRIDLPGFSFTGLEADVVNLGHLENRRGARILGLFGMSLFQSLELAIDLKNSELVLYPVDRRGNRMRPETDSLPHDLECPLREAGGVAFIQASIGGKNLDFCLDTGAESNVISSSAPRKSLETVNITRRSALSGSGSNETDVLFGTMNDFVLNGHTLHPMTTMITRLDALAAAYNFPLSGVLGYDFFEKGVVCINLVKKQLVMTLRKGEVK